MESQVLDPDGGLLSHGEQRQLLAWGERSSRLSSGKQHAQRPAGGHQRDNRETTHSQLLERGRDGRRRRASLAGGHHYRLAAGHESIERLQLLGQGRVDLNRLTSHFQSHGPPPSPIDQCDTSQWGVHDR